MTGGMEKSLEKGKADRSRCFKKTDINVSLTGCLTTGPGWRFIPGMIGWEHIMQRQNNITAMFFCFWAVWCAMHMLDWAVYTTSVSQPMGEGVICCTKQNYWECSYDHV